VEDDQARPAHRDALLEVTDGLQDPGALCPTAEQFRLAFDNGPLGMLFIDLERMVVRANPALGAILGYSSGEFQGRSLADITHPEDLQSDRELFGRLVRNEIPNYTIRKRYRAKDGHTVWAEVTVTLLAQSDRPLAFAMVKDVTVQHQVEVALHRAERLASLGTLAAGIAHEVNNPLGAIVLVAETACHRAERLDPILHGALQQIRQQAIRCGQIVQSVLKFSREQKSEKWLARLEESVERAADFTRHLAKQNDVVLVLDLDSTATPPLMINPTEMEQVFINLISNGVQACQTGGHVCVRVRTERDCVQATVENDGPAMSAEQAAHLFDPFYTTRAGGTGLGLSIVQGIVQDHGARIHVESGPGQGTRFQLAIPLPPPSGPQA
jgi:PAS domain S-box-containing protein